MSDAAWLFDLLTQVTELLLVPVGILLVLGLGWSQLQLGQCLRQWWDRNVRKMMPTYRDATVDEIELGMNLVLSRLTIVVRVAPMLGLMGTLIPLGPVMNELQSGNSEQLAKNLLIAFSTTIIGLWASGCCYVVWQCRRNWYAADLLQLSHESPSGLGLETVEGDD